MKKKGPLWGFHEPTVTAGAGVDAAAQDIGQHMQDPRFGMASGLGAAAGVLGGARKFGQMMNPKTRAAMEGGFSVPTSQMRREIPTLNTPSHDSIRPMGQPPTGEQAVRNDYLEDVYARNMHAIGAEDNAGDVSHRPFAVNDGERLFKFGPSSDQSEQTRELLKRTLQGRHDLRQERASQSDPRSGGGVLYRPNTRTPEPTITTIGPEFRFGPLHQEMKEAGPISKGGQDIPEAKMGQVIGLNDAAKMMMDKDRPLHMEVARAAYRMLKPEQKDLINKTITGQSELRSELYRQKYKRPNWDTNN